MVIPARFSGAGPTLPDMEEDSPEGQKKHRPPFNDAM